MSTCEFGLALTNTPSSLSWMYEDRTVRFCPSMRMPAPLLLGASTVAPVSSTVSTVILLPSKTQVPFPAAFRPAASIRGRPFTPWMVRLLASTVHTSPK